MGRPWSFTDGVQRHPELPAPPVSTRFWQQRFQPYPPTSLEALLVRLGPFIPPRDAFQFSNQFAFTDDQIEQIRGHYRPYIDLALGATPLGFVRDALSKLSIHIPWVGNVGLPDFVIDYVLGNVLQALIELLADVILNLYTPKNTGRCGGMAFSGYDFYLLDWPVDSRLGTTPPATGPLGDYIFSRLLDSLDLNALKFLEWFADLHLLPKAEVSSVAQAALVAAVATLGGPIGEAFAALIAVVNVFGDLGGPRKLLSLSKDEWPRIKNQLDGQAAWPIGLLFRGSATPFEDHQILALDYEDDANGTALIVWDNRDGPYQRRLQIDFTGNELTVQIQPDPIVLSDGSKIFWGGGNEPDGGNIKGIFLENYSPQRPPDSSHFPYPRV
jgi:hypothetical protein